MESTGSRESERLNAVSGAREKEREEVGRRPRGPIDWDPFLPACLCAGPRFLHSLARRCSPRLTYLTQGNHSGDHSHTHSHSLPGQS